MKPSRYAVFLHPAGYHVIADLGDPLTARTYANPEPLKRLAEFETFPAAERFVAMQVELTLPLKNPAAALTALRPAMPVVALGPIENPLPMNPQSVVFPLALRSYPGVQQTAKSRRIE